MKNCKVKDICSKGSSNLKQKDVEGKMGLYPVYGASGVISNIDIYHQDNEYIAIVKDGSGIGRVSFMPPKSSVIGTMQYILPKDGYDIRYIGYCLQSLDLSKYKQGAAIPHIYFRDYGERNIRVCEDLAEQRRIVSYLDSSFDLIDKIKEDASKSLSEAKALFQSALAEAMEPKEGWEEKTLKDLGFTQTGTTPSKSHEEFYGGDIPFIRPSEININGNGVINYDSEIKLSKKGAEAGRLFPKGSIFMVCIGATIGKVGYSDSMVSCNQQINVLTPTKEYNFKYLFYAMCTVDFQKRVIKEGTSAQATLPIINKGKWEKLTINIPPLSTQKQIVSRLDKLSSKVRAMEEKYQKMIAECDALKQAMLREVFE